MPPPLNHSTSYSSATGPSSESGNNEGENQVTSEVPKFFFQEKYAKLGVKGNFMPLAAKPTHVNIADWIAHQSKLPNP